MLICLPAAAMGLAMGVNSGKYLFNAMVIAGFVLCSAACLLTSDAVSSERREGTLGLLLLTKAGDLDVLLGKFCSNGLTSLLALLALVPVFAIPVLGGGVTGTEILRKGLALGNALVFALAVGIYASAPESDRVRAARKAIFTSVLWNCVPLVALVGAAQGAKLLSLPAIFSPVLALACASDSTYQSAPYLFWLGLAGGQVASWFMVKRAAGELGRTLREEEVSVTPILSSTIPQSAEPRIPELVDDEHGPVHWLVDRQRGVRAAIWAAALIGISANAGTIALLRFVGTGMGFMPYYSVPGFVTSILGGCLLAWAASRFFLDARRRGELELLLTTPEGSKNIVSGQWAALKGMIAGPLLVMMVPFVIQVLTYATRPVGSFGFYFLFSAVLGVVNTLLSVATLCWIGMWFGLKSRGQAATILRTVALAKLVPYIGAVVAQMILIPLMASGGGPGMFSSYRFFYLVPQIGTVLVYAALIAYAQKSLARELTGAEPMRFSLRPAGQGVSQS
jgi:ABC-type transport system involved in cytochrome c biogenesis permease component